jgi:hypothetical protein
MLGVAEIEQLPVAQARAGDATAWDALFRRCRLPLYVYIFELVREEQEAEFMNLLDQLPPPKRPLGIRGVPLTGDWVWQYP